MIPFNKPYMTGNELAYIADAVKQGKISGDGLYTKKCQQFFAENYGFSRNLLTTSCTDALEMAAILIDINIGDEVIMPSYTFVSTSNAFVLRGAKIVFADSKKDSPNIDEDQLEDLITNKTKAIVVVHYAGIACDMDKVQAIAARHNLFLIEDAAQAIDATYKGKPLGSFGDLAAFSFHETKNVIAGEGGLLVVNNESMWRRAEIIREKGTNRSEFFRGEVDKYGWVDIGSSFLPSDIIAAFLFAQLESIQDIQQRRKKHWDHYYAKLYTLEKEGFLKLPIIPDYATNNAHMFYIVCNNIEDRTALIEFMKRRLVNPVFHYLSLHKSPFYSHNHDGRDLPFSDYYTDRLLRLPLYYELTNDDVDFISESVIEFYKQK
ncbi:TDP-4-oxo-6-deoxy-D-glucose aminotransferase [Bacteroidetes bacterium UKL13-3]|nr:TDP-4-oxo-6-deoxy-D-glucose aminotransferase [Bacteroidetes bacterium UKL13-3]HCP93945.1 dTDP-4-amino-4,6-dideoxygalactose transaminase [Bacteroidota bacterium]